MHMQRVPDKLDNFPPTLLLGTPGVGKSRICAEIAKRCSLKWQDVSKIAKDKGFVEEHDEQLDCPVLDEDKVIVARLNFDPFGLLTPDIYCFSTADGPFGTRDVCRRKYC